MEQILRFDFSRVSFDKKSFIIKKNYQNYLSPKTTWLRPIVWRGHFCPFHERVFKRMKSLSVFFMTVDFFKNVSHSTATQFKNFIEWHVQIVMSRKRLISAISFWCCFWNVTQRKRGLICTQVKDDVGGIITTTPCYIKKIFCCVQYLLHSNVLDRLVSLSIINIFRNPCSKNQNVLNVKAL